MRLQHILAAAACSSALFAQAPANDTCAGAIAVNLGSNGPFTNVGATSGGVTPMPCGVQGVDNDVWFTWVAPTTGNATASTCGAGYDSKMEILEGTCAAPVSITCLDDSCGLQQEITWSAVAGTTYYIRIGGFNGATGTFPLDVSIDFGFDIEGVAEATPGSGTLGLAGGNFTDGYDLRWNYNDISGMRGGLFAVTAVNIGIGGSAATAITPQIPGFSQQWPGSMPAGPVETFGPFVVGGPDQATTVPAGLFNSGDTVRIQGLVLDAATAIGSLPVVPSSNTIEFVYVGTPAGCAEFEGFEFATQPSLPAGWTDGGGVLSWTTDSGGTPSAATGPTSAAEGTTYLYCETSFPAVQGDTYIVESPVYTNQSVTNCDFELNRIGTAVGTLEVFLVDTGTGTATLLNTYVGPDPAQSQGVLEWSSESLSLGTLPASYQIRFTYAAGPSATGSGSTFSGDLAIDRFCLN